MIPVAIGVGYYVAQRNFAIRAELQQMATCKHIIVEGDRVWNLASRHIKDRNRYSMDDIMARTSEINAGKNLNKLRPGDEVDLLSSNGTGEYCK